MRKLLTFSLLFCGALIGHDEGPLWSYDRMNTVGSFEGLVFMFTRPPASTADITVTAIVDGKEIHVTHQVKTARPTEEDLTAGRFPMSIGSLDTFRVTHIEITSGGYADAETDPRPGKSYTLKEGM